MISYLIIYTYLSYFQIKFSDKQLKALYESKSNKLYNTKSSENVRLVGQDNIR